MAILVNDTPPLPGRIICHRNRTPSRNVVHMAIHATHTSPFELLVKLPPRSLETEVVGGWGGWWVEKGTAHTTCTKTEGETARERDRKGAVIPFSPASAPTISPARTQRCSWARRDTSWCLPFYPGAPTHSCGEVGVKEGWGVGWKRANPYQVVSMATSHFQFKHDVCPHYPCSLSSCPSPPLMII